MMNIYHYIKKDTHIHTHIHDIDSTFVHRQMNMTLRNWHKSS